MEKDIKFLEKLEKEEKQLRFDRNQILSNPLSTNDDKKMVERIEKKIQNRILINNAYHKGQKESNSWTNYEEINKQEFQKEDGSVNFEKQCCWAIGDRCGEIEICKLIYGSIKTIKEKINVFKENNPYLNDEAKQADMKAIEDLEDELADLLNIFTIFNTEVFGISSEGKEDKKQIKNKNGFNSFLKNFKLNK